MRAASVRKAAVWTVSIGLLIVIGYGSIGFFLAPYLIRSKLLPNLAARFGVGISVGTVEVDPFAFTARLRDFSLKDKNGRELLTFKELFGVLDAADSWRQRMAVVEANLVGPSIRVELDGQGKFNLAKPAPAKDKDSKPKSGSVPLLIKRFELQQGRLEFRDAARGKTFSTLLNDLSGHLENFGFEPQRKAEFGLAAKSENRESLAVQGSLALFPLALEGKIEAAEVALAPLIGYLAPQSSVRIAAGRASIGGNYRLRFDDRTAFEISADGNVRGLNLIGRDGDPFLKAASVAVRRLDYSLQGRRLRLGSVAAKDIGVDGGESGIKSLELTDLVWALTGRSIDIGSVISDKGEINVRLAAGGRFGVSGFPAAAAGAGSAESPKPWTVRIGEARLSGYSLGFRDETADPPVELRFTPLSVRLANLTTETGSTMEFDLESGLGKQGIIRAQGRAGLDPLTVDSRLDFEKLSLRPLQPYLDPWVGIGLVRGRLNLTGDLVLSRQDEFRASFTGGAEITDFATVDKKERKDFINWRSLRLDGVTVDTRPKRFSIRSVTAREPYARVVIAKDGGLNIARELARNESAKTGHTPGKDEDGWPIAIGSVHVADGRMYFSDLTLKPNFGMEIHSLTGAVRGLFSRSDTKAEVLLEGRINHSSPVNISGQINPFKISTYTDLALRFRDVNLTTLSPYSGKFAGYRIEKGKLNMDLHYKLADRKLRADNKMVLDQLVLGERVDSPEATSLPIRLAIALLRNSDGRINLDLPVSGNLDDPKFSLRGLLASAVTKMVTKLIGSPFAILGSLVPNGGEELGYVKFRAGDATLGEEEKAKLTKVAAVLKERPGVSLDIKSCADLEQDRMALAELELLKRLKSARLLELRSRGQLAGKTQEPALSETDFRRLLADFFRARQPNSPEMLAWQDTDGNLLDHAKHELLKNWTVSELDLRLLAQARSESIRSFLVREAGLPDRRIYLLDVKIAEPGDKDIKSFLSLSAIN
jgi:hypothetical protein